MLRVIQLHASHGLCHMPVTRHYSCCMPVTGSCTTVVDHQSCCIPVTLRMGQCTCSSPNCKSRIACSCQHTSEGDTCVEGQLFRCIGSHRSSLMLHTSCWSHGMPVSHYMTLACRCLGRPAGATASHFCTLVIVNLTALARHSLDDLGMQVFEPAFKRNSRCSHTSHWYHYITCQSLIT